jgi:Phage integrase family
LAALRATLAGRGQTAQAIDVTVVGLTSKPSAKEALSEFCDFISFVLETPVSAFAVEHVVNFAASRLHGERRGRTAMTEQGVVAIFNKIFTWLNAFTDGAFRNPDDHQTIAHFKKGLSVVAKRPKQPISSVPDMEVFLRFLSEAPAASDVCPDCLRTILTLLFMVSLPMRPDDVRKIVLSGESSVLDGDVVTFRFWERKRQPGFSTPFRIRDQQLADYLTVYLEKTASSRVRPAPAVEFLIAPLTGQARQLSADTVSNYLQRLMTLLQIPSELTPRRLRDMTATALMVSTDDIEFVKRAGGWKQAAILQDRYLKENLLVNAQTFRQVFTVHLQEGGSTDRVVVRAANIAH